MSENEAVREFEWKGRTGPFTLELTPGVFTPSHTSLTLAEGLEVGPRDVVLDVGCGSGVLSFVAAFLGAQRVVGCDISEESVRNASLNARRLGLDDRTDFRVGDMLEPVSDVRADVVIGDVSGVPDPVAEATGWFPDGKGGGPTGAELPVAMIEGLGDNLKRGGRLYLPTGTIQAEAKVLEAARRVFGPNNMQLLLEREFPLPNLVAGSKAVARLVSDGLVQLKRRGSRLMWRLAVWRCLRA